MSWSEEGCWVAFSNENYTICSCSHLSTFALIMQIGEVYIFFFFFFDEFIINLILSGGCTDFVFSSLHCVVEVI